MEQANTAPQDRSEQGALELAKENGRLRREVEAQTRQRDILEMAIRPPTSGHPFLRTTRSEEERVEAVATATAPAPITVRGVGAALRVSESGFYAYRRKAERPRRVQDEQIAEQTKQVFEP